MLRVFLMAFEWVGTEGLEPNRPGLKSCLLALRPQGGLFVSLSFSFLSDCHEGDGRTTGGNTFPSGGKSLGSIRSPFPVSCSSVSLLLGQAFTLPLRGSWVQVCSRFSSGTKLPRVPYAVPSCSAQEDTVVVEAGMGFSGLPPLTAWGGN